ncbi:hypothetical protein DSL72_003848 [Monilinia vaccinii-corymbosi]|uniref:NADH dehydrogenase [ubiquinone] 1 alpha subcomplex assembly factor 3 n=1 Tax=Monilinia vaccinii-corymbosi TaxID=61207 RepID=A0A8A3P0Q3_9HELO|nr:hypothetical protein DSL72_003848 [Monilinia vaccinii-corymbosi]
MKRIPREGKHLRPAFTYTYTVPSSRQPRSIHLPQPQSRAFSQKTTSSFSISSASQSSPSSSSSSHLSSHPPRTHDRGPPSSETTQTDFGTLDVLGNTPPPSTSIDACLSDGFHLNSGLKVGGDGRFIKGKGWTKGSGVLLVAGEAFGWRPWVHDGGEADAERGLVNGKGQFEVGDEAWGILSCVWPRPDILILGLGKEMRPISPKTRAFINGLGIQIEIADTRNAAAQFNLLATERGVNSVAAALVPIGR